MKKYIASILAVMCGFTFALASSISNNTTPVSEELCDDGSVCEVDFSQPVAAESAGESCESEEDKIPVSLFHSPTCPHCKAEKLWLLELAHERGDIDLHLYDVSTPEGFDVYTEFTDLEGLQKVVPFTLVDNQIISGFDTVENRGAEILALINNAEGQETLPVEAFIEAGGSKAFEHKQKTVTEQLQSITIPIIGKTVDLSWMPLPMLSVTLGFIDGFNPCAMWVLVTFLMILAQIGDRKRMMQIAGIFIVAEAIMYYMILNVWFYTWNFVQLNQYIVPIVALVSIGGGIFFLWEFKQGDGTCKVTNAKQRAQISKRINLLANAKMGVATVFSIILLALSVNVIEFACSIGIPQMFTKVLEINNLSFWEYQGYMLLYILFYMIDDVIVFAIALWGMEYIGLTTKYIRYTNLIGGILMILLGIVMMWKPEMLVF